LIIVQGLLLNLLPLAQDDNTLRKITHPSLFAEGKFCHTSLKGRFKLVTLRLIGI
jgi:hypothetical protein